MKDSRFDAVLGRVNQMLHNNESQIVLTQETARILISGFQAAKESDRQRIAELEADVEERAAATQYNYEIILKLREQIEVLEKKLAEQQAIYAALRKNWPLYVCPLPLESEELTKREAAARQQGFEEGRKLAVDTQQKLFDDGKQAGRDEVLMELSEQEPEAHMYPSDLLRFAVCETFATAFSVAVGNPDETSVPMIRQPNKPTKE